MNIFNLSLQINGFPIKKATSAYHKIIQLNEEAYPAYLSDCQNAVFNYHLKNNAFYKTFIGNKKIESWSDIPVMTKKNMQIPLQDRLSKGFSLSNCYINKTSGSSGDPFIFAKDKFCHALTWASVFNRFGWYGLNFNNSLQARFYGIPLDLIGNTKERIKDLLSHRYRFSVFDLSDVVFEKTIQVFKQKKFVYINGYTSSIVLFAKFLEKKNILLKEICPSLRCCVVTSEMLFEEDKKLMETYFGIPVINEYGASELDIIAFQHPEGDWLINNETILVEIVDEHNNPLPNGSEGKIVITSLYNFAHPFIRYEIGDIGIIDERSTPKKQILKKLIGRTNDIAILPSGKKSPGLTFYYVTKSIIEDTGNIKEFIVKQIKIDTFEIEYVSEQPLTKAQMKKIEHEMFIYLEQGLTIVFSRKQRLERSKSGKLKQFQSLINP